jgi:Ca2+-binding EF-hand superfamily protein
LTKQFNNLDLKRDNEIDFGEFCNGIGLLNSKDFARILFSIFDFHDSLSIQMFDFKYVIGLLLRGDRGEQLKLIYRIFDPEDKGYVSFISFASIIQKVFNLLDSLCLEIPNDLNLHIKQLFQKMTTQKDFISKEDFFKNCDVIATLGLYKSGNKKMTEIQGTNVFIGHPSFQKVISMMLGIRISVNSE